MRVLFSLCLLTATAAQAQAQTPGEPRNDKERPIEEIVVLAHPLSAEGLAQATLSLEGDALTRNMSSTVAETLARQPGIQNSSFGNAAGRPVIRGLAGPRVRLMEDRLDTLDVSVTSADHASSVDALVADRIEVLKGPSTLVYGSGAIGGVVDVHTGRIPHARSEAVSGGVEARIEDSTEQRSTVGELDFGTGPIAVHIDGFYRDANDYDIPGCVESDLLREAEGGEPCEQDDSLPGSDLETWGGAFGASYVGDRGFAGFAVSRFDSDYGLPGGHAEDGDQGADNESGSPTINLDQARYDFEAGYEDPLPGFSSVNLRVVYNDYEHKEIEPDGEVATRFDNEAWDTRLELNHHEVLGFRGAAGVQYSYKEFSALGEEAFIEPVDSKLLAAFWVGERSLSMFQLETGFRVESVEHKPDTSENETFTLFSTSAGLVMPFGDGWEAGLQADYSERAPVPEELYSNGAHLATQAFEIGDPNLDQEQALNFSATVGFDSDYWRLNASIYYTSFSDFIYEFFTGVDDAESGLPILQFTQDDAEYYGMDFSAGLRVASYPEGELWLNGMFDYVEAELDVNGNDNLPRLPPWRVGVGAQGTWKSVTATVDYLYADEQDDVTEFELATDDYEDLRIFVGATLPVDFGVVEVFVQGKNLTDDEQRYHTSFIKDFAPQPGRTVEGGVRVTF